MGPVMQDPPPPETTLLEPDEAPLYWQKPGMLLDLFGEMAERNLFLVQHLQGSRQPTRFAWLALLCHGLRSPWDCALDLLCTERCWQVFTSGDCENHDSVKWHLGTYSRAGLPCVARKRLRRRLHARWWSDPAEHVLPFRARRSRWRRCAVSCGQRAPPWTRMHWRCRARWPICAPPSPTRSAT